MKTPKEIIKEHYPFYDENIAQKDIEINSEAVIKLMQEYADQFSIPIESPVSDDFGNTFTQGICEDGAVILCDGKPMTPELIVALLNKYNFLEKKLHYKIVSQNSR